MKERLTIEIDFTPTDETRAIPHPTEYEVIVYEPLAKTAELPPGTMQFLTREMVAVLLVLQQVGFVPWVTSRAYTALWDYLKAFVGSLPHTLPGRMAKIEIKDEKGESVLVEIPDLTLAALDEAKVSVTETLNGKNRERKTVISLKKKP